MKNLLEEIQALKSDQTHGASYLALQAVNILKKAAFDIEAADNISFIQAINSLAENIKNIRPSMVSIYNLVSDYAEKLNQEENRLLSLPSLRQKAARIADDITCQVLEKQKQTIKKGSTLIKDRSTLITCSYSSTIAETVKTAYAEGKRFDIIIARSCPKDSPYAYGEIMAAKLEVPLNIKVIADENIPSYLAQADYALIGADAVLHDRSVINGYPSLFLAEASFQHKIPFYVVCEPHKVAGENFRPHLEAGFELIPAPFITAIITG